MALQNELAVRRSVAVYIAGIQRRGLGWRPDAASGGRASGPKFRP